MEFVSFFGGGKEDAPADGKDRPVRLGGAEPAPYVPAPTAANIGGGGAGKSRLKDELPDVTGGDAAKQSKKTEEQVRLIREERAAADERACLAALAAERAAEMAAAMKTLALNRSAAAIQGSSAPQASSSSGAALGSKISSALASKPAASPAPAKGGMGMSQ